MNPNRFPWHTSASHQYQSLDEQLGRLTLSPGTSTNNPWLFSPSASSSDFEPLRQQRPYYNHIDLASNHRLGNNTIINGSSINNYSNGAAFSYPTLGQNPVSIPTELPETMTTPTRDYYGRHVTPSSHIINNTSYIEYLAMLRYLHTNGNQFSAFQSRFENVNHVNHPRSVRNNNIEQRARREVGRNNYKRNSNHIRHKNENHLVDLGLSWERLKGNVASFVKDHQRYKLVQQMLEKATRAQIKMILSEVKDELGNIVVTYAGCQFFQRLLDFCDDQDDVTEILRAAMINQQCFVDICLDNHGSRAMQKLIKKIDEENAEQKSLIFTMMKEVMLTLITNMNSYYFVTELFTSLKGPPAYDLITPLFDEIGDHFLEIAVNKFGCCALHTCLEHGHRCAQRDRIMQKVVFHALELSENDYGNYVVQYVISKPQERYSHDIIRSLYGKFAYFCMNKYACHVVEKCILFGTNEHLEIIVQEIIEDQNFLKILLDQTGNYVVQTAITRCNEVSGHSEALSTLFYKLADGVIAKYPFLHYDRLGKHVLHCARTEKEKNRRRTLH